MSALVPLVVVVMVAIMVYEFIMWRSQTERFFELLGEALETWKTYPECRALGMNEKHLRRWLPLLYEQRKIEYQFADDVMYTAEVQAFMRQYVIDHAERVKAPVPHELLSYAAPDQILRLFSQYMFAPDTIAFFQYRRVPSLPDSGRSRKRDWKFKLPEWFPQPLPA
jgi:hypothetical protein